MFSEKSFFENKAGKMDGAWPMRTQNSRHLVIKLYKLYTIGKTGMVNILFFFYKFDRIG